MLILTHTLVGRHRTTVTGSVNNSTTRIKANIKEHTINLIVYVLLFQSDSCYCETDSVSFAAKVKSLLSIEWTMCS